MSFLDTLTDNIFGLISNGQKYRQSKRLADQEFNQSMELERMAIQEQLDANLKLADYQTERNLEFWNMQNEYNSPAQQMARFKQAGLNPALMYSQGSPGNASELVKYQAPTASKANYRTKAEFARANLKLFQDMRASEATINQMEMQNLMIEANIGKIQAETDLIKNHKPDLWDSQAILNYSRAHKTDSDMQREEDLHQFKLKQLDLSNQLLEKDLPLKDIALRLNQAQESYVRQSIEESKSRIPLNNSLRNYYQSAKELNDAKVSKTAIDTDISQYTYNEILPKVVEHKKAQITKLVAEGKITAEEAKVKSEKLQQELKILDQEYKMKYQQNWSKFLGIDDGVKYLNAIGSIIPF